ncbi:AAA family ATPase [Microcoleus sp. MON1_C5]
MPRIRVTSLTFDENKFRRLKNLTIPIAERITVIAGHNGIGKSTILGLIAHQAGLTNRAAGGHKLGYTSKQNTSYFDKTYQANFGEIIHLDYIGDYHSKLGPPPILGQPKIHFLIDEKEVLGKACRVEPRKNHANPNEVRVVSRSVEPSTSKFVSESGKIVVGPAGKVPLPTIYLGMTRVLPLGEAEQGTVASSTKKMDASDAALIASFFNSVITGSEATPSKITAHRINNTGKISGQPAYKFDPKCVSLGQDSLGSIALALASFQKLKREWANYPGGLLIIDELDAGFHPHAIGKLVKALKSQARKLDLQIIATTHSLRLIEAVHPESEPLNNELLDGVVYLRDPGRPKVLDNPSFQTIAEDMELLPPKKTAKEKVPKLKVYFEDDEATAVFKAIAELKYLKALGIKHGVKLDCMPLGVGCENLVALGDHDPYFKKVVMVLDADASASRANEKYKHTARLPGDMYTGIKTGTENKTLINRPLSPERTLLQYLKNIISDADAHGDTLDRLDITTTHVSDLLLENEISVLAHRTRLKEWWASKLSYIKDWKLLESWVADRPTEVAKFKAEFEAAVEEVAKRLKN